MNARSVAYLLAITGWTMSCNSNDGNPAVSGSGGSTGTIGIGGQVGLGGNASGGTNSATGGVVSSNGGTASGGTVSSNGGAAKGGTVSSNGGAATGGTVSANGGAATGGTVSSNGGAAKGGTVSSNGGAATGGTVSSNGGTATNTGGTAGKGGAVSTMAGSIGRGGASTGGAQTSGGSNTAGAAQGCGVTGAATGAQNLTIQIAGQDRAYVLFVPTNYTATTAMPLIFAWHGLGGNGTMARQYFRIEQAASNQAIFVYPTGLPNSSGQAAWTLTQTGVDVQFFDALLADVSSKYCVDRTRVYSTGHSYGAMMTNALGCYRSNVLRGIAPVAGMPPFGNVTCTGAVAAWIAHGENDATVDFTTGGVASRDLWLKLNTCDATTTPTAVEPSPCVAYQGCSDGHPVHWCVHQDDHNWPSFAGAGIWAFFNSLK